MVVNAEDQRRLREYREPTWGYRMVGGEIEKQIFDGAIPAGWFDNPDCTSPPEPEPEKTAGDAPEEAEPEAFDSVGRDPFQPLEAAAEDIGAPDDGINLYDGDDTIEPEPAPDDAPLAGDIETIEAGGGDFGYEPPVDSGDALSDDSGDIDDLVADDGDPLVGESHDAEEPSDESEPAPPPERPDYMAMTKSKLRAAAEEMGGTLPSGMPKLEMVEFAEALWDETHGG